MDHAGFNKLTAKLERDAVLEKKRSKVTNPITSTGSAAVRRTNAP